MASQGDYAAWLSRLQQARVSGVRTIRDSDGSEITYRSDSELAAAINYVNGLLSPQSVKTLKFQTSKGL